MLDGRLDYLCDVKLIDSEGELDYAYINYVFKGYNISRSNVDISVESFKQFSALRNNFKNNEKSYSSNIAHLIEFENSANRGAKYGNIDANIVNIAVDCNKLLDQLNVRHRLYD